MREDNSDLLRKNFQTASILYYAISAAVVFYGGLAYFLIEQVGMQARITAGEDVIRGAFILTALGGLMFTGKLRKLLLPVTHENRPPQEVLTGKLLNADIVTCAFCELPALLGFILAVLLADTGEFYLFGFISFAGLANNIPRYERWEEYVRHNYLP